MEKKEFFSQLAEKFPWSNMEEITNPETLKHMSSEEWAEVAQILEPWKEQNPLRCISVIDFIAKMDQEREKDEVTLAYYKREDVVKLIVPFYEEALKQGLTLSVKETLTLQFILYFHEERRAQMIQMLTKIMEEQLVCARDIKVEREYLEGYKFVWRGSPSTKMFASFL